MTIQECYAMIDGDLQDVLSRLVTEARVTKFVLRFPADGTYAELRDAMAKGDRETAFRAAHTMKGVAQNLGFKALYQPAHDLTEAFRPGNAPIPAQQEQALFEEVTKQYNRTIAAIEAFQA